jgi:hypothetical protein
MCKIATFFGLSYGVQIVLLLGLVAFLVSPRSVQSAAFWWLLADLLCLVAAAVLLWHAYIPLSRATAAAANAAALARGGVSSRRGHHRRAGVRDLHELTLTPSFATAQHHVRRGTFQPSSRNRPPTMTLDDDVIMMLTGGGGGGGAGGGERSVVGSRGWRATAGATEHSVNGSRG